MSYLHLRSGLSVSRLACVKDAFIQLLAISLGSTSMELCCTVVPCKTSGASMTLPRGSTSISPHWRRVRRGLVTCRRENDGIRHISSWHWHLPVTCHSLCYSDPCAQFSGFVCFSFVSLGWEGKLPTQIIWPKWSWRPRPGWSKWYAFI